MLGHPLIGAFHGIKSGHAMNNQLVRTLLADLTAWEYVTYDKRDQLPAAFGNMALSPA
jgi:UDP-3-O-[3-hydroxymyristoyl] N-acetylglucosamine deacetylase